MQKFLSSTLLYKNIKIKVYRTIILPVVLYGYKTRSPTLIEERRLRVLRGIFGLKRDEVKGGWEKYLMRNLMRFTPHGIIFG